MTAAHGCSHNQAHALCCARKRAHLCCAEHFPDAPGLRQHGILLTMLLLSGSPCCLLFFRRLGRRDGRLLRLQLGAAVQLLLLRKLLWHRVCATLPSLGMHALSSGAACSWPALLLHHSSHIIPGWRLPTIACGCGVFWCCRAKLLQAQPKDGQSDRRRHHVTTSVVISPATGHGGTSLSDAQPATALPPAPAATPLLRTCERRRVDIVLPCFGCHKGKSPPHSGWGRGRGGGGVVLLWLAGGRIGIGRSASP